MINTVSTGLWINIRSWWVSPFRYNCYNLQCWKISWRTPETKAIGEHTVLTVLCRVCGSVKQTIMKWNFKPLSIRLGCVRVRKVLTHLLWGRSDNHGLVHMSHTLRWSSFLLLVEQQAALWSEWKNKLLQFECIWSSFKNRFVIFTLLLNET